MPPFMRAEPPALVLVESNTTGTGRLFVRLARERGLRVVVLAADPSRWGVLAAEGAEVHPADTQDAAAVLEACRALGPVAGVTSSSEYFIATAAEAARALGLAGPSPEGVRACRDKQTQRAILAGAGVGQPRFAAAESVGEVLDACAAIGFPVVLKPVNGSGSVGVRLCANADEAAAHAASLLAVRANERGIAVRAAVLVEEMAVGPEYSVEVFGGASVGITAKHCSEPPFFVEIGHDHPAPLSPADEEALRSTALAAVRALGVEWGPSHVELRLTARGPAIMEVNPRLAGGFIPELVRRASGVDLIGATLSAVCGEVPETAIARRRFASIRFLLPPVEGMLAAIAGREDALALPHVDEVSAYAAPGTTVRRAGDFRDRIGHVIAVADASADAVNAADRALARVRVEVETNPAEAAAREPVPAAPGPVSVPVPVLASGG